MTDTIICGDALTTLQTLPDASVDMCVTSPPYFGLRDYGVPGQLGLEPTPQEYVAHLVEVFREVRRVFKDTGTLWLNLGDSYASAWACSRRNIIGLGSLENGKREARPNRLGNGLKEKDLIGIPWRVAFALQDDGWYLRSDIIWHKPNCMPESVKTRPTKAHEYLFLLAKSEKYYYDANAIREPHTLAQRVKGREPNFASHKWLPPTGTIINNNRSGGDGVGFNPLGRNRRTVWTIATRPYKGAHFATFPPALIEPCIKAGCPEGGLVLDPFIGSGTTAAVANSLGRHYLGIELNAEYVRLAEERINAEH